MSNVLLVDGDNLLTIGFYGLKNHFYKGNHIGALYHFVNTLRKAIEIYKLDKVVVFWDGKEGSLSRKKYYHHYKENRKGNIKTEEQIHSYEQQRNRVKQYIEELFVRQGEYEFCETDDAIAYYSQNSKNENITIYSSDGDLTQLVSENTRLFNPSHSKMYNLKDTFVYNHEQIRVENIKIIKILCGDPSDNIAGIKNLGIKRLLSVVPELQNEIITLDFIRNRFNELFDLKKNRNSFVTNLLTGVTKHGVLGEEFFFLNEKIVSLDEPFLTNEAKENIMVLVNDLLDPEGRSYKNTMKMMMEDGLHLLLSKSDDAWVNFLNPFLRLIQKEKNKKIIKIKTHE
jgi:5'-3' exonuclease